MEEITEPATTIPPTTPPPPPTTTTTPPPPPPPIKDDEPVGPTDTDTMATAKETQTTEEVTKATTTDTPTSPTPTTQDTELDLHLDQRESEVVDRESPTAKESNTHKPETSTNTHELETAAATNTDETMKETVEVNETRQSVDDEDTMNATVETNNTHHENVEDVDASTMEVAVQTNNTYTDIVDDVAASTLKSTVETNTTHADNVESIEASTMEAAVQTNNTQPDNVDTNNTHDDNVDTHTDNVDTQPDHVDTQPDNVEDIDASTMEAAVDTNTTHTDNVDGIVASAIEAVQTNTTHNDNVADVATPHATVSLTKFNALKAELWTTKQQLKEMDERFEQLEKTVAANAKVATANEVEESATSKLEKHLHDQLTRMKTRLVDLEKKERLKSATAAYNNASKIPQDQATDTKVAQLEQMLVGMLMPHITGSGLYEGPVEYSFNEASPQKRNASARKSGRGSRRPPSRGSTQLAPMDQDETTTTTATTTAAPARRSSFSNSITDEILERERRISALEHGISSLLLVGTQPIPSTHSRANLTSGKHQRLDLSKLSAKIDQQSTTVTKLQGQVRRLINSVATVKKEMKAQGQYDEWSGVTGSQQSTQFSSHSRFTPYLPIPTTVGKKTNHAGPVGRMRAPSMRLATAPSSRAYQDDSRFVLPGL